MQSMAHSVVIRHVFDAGQLHQNTAYVGTHDMHSSSQKIRSHEAPLAQFLQVHHQVLLCICFTLTVKAYICFNFSTWGTAQE